jgi:hypothetical protein
MLNDEDKELIIDLLRTKARYYTYQAEHVKTGLPGDNGQAWAKRFEERVNKIIDIIEKS